MIPTSILVACVAFCASCFVAHAQIECTQYLTSAEGLFQKPFYMQTRFENSYLRNVTLLERHTYYSCEPHEEKFGIESSGKEWWVFKGCGGIFEIEECVDDPTLQLRLKENIPPEQKEMELKTMEEFGLIKEELITP